MTTTKPDAAVSQDGDTYAVRFGTSTLHVTSTRKYPVADAVPIAERRKVKAGYYYSIPYADAPTAVAWADQHHLPVDPAVRAFAADLWVRELDAMSLATTTALPPNRRVVVDGLKTTLLPTQEVMVAAAADAWITHPGANKKTHRAVIVADVPGLGKTIEALSSLRIPGQHCERAVIICPTSLTENWQAEMALHFDLSVFLPWIAQGQTPGPIPGDCNAVVIGWEILAHWAEALAGWKPDAVIADEGHYAKSGKLQTQTHKETQVVRDDDGAVVRDAGGNLQMVQVETTKKVGGSARASGLLDIGAAVMKSHGLLLALTGTPIVNRPLELAPLLEFTGIVHLFGGTTGYKNRFCGPEKKSIGGGRTTIDYSGASNLLELHARLAASGHYVRRTKWEMVRAGVMKPKIVDGVDCFDHTTRPNPWIIVPTQAEMAEYHAAESDTADFFATRAAEIARDLRAGVDTERVQRKVAAEGHKHLTRITELRKLAALIKVPYVVDQVRKVVERGEKVVIAAHHREVVDAYAEAFTGLKIQGSMGVTKIEQAKRLFNDTPTSEHPVIVLSVEAGKTGHTLCKQSLAGVGPACAYMVFAEQVWTPGDETQAQDRIWRIGQDRQVRIINALLAETIDQQVYGLRAKKARVVNAAIDAIDPSSGVRGSDEKEGQGLIARDLARRGHATLL